MFATQKALIWLRGHAQPGSTGWCAKYTREAIEAGGLILQRSVSAKDYGASLIKAGFRKLIISENVQAGDVVVIDAVDGEPDGHMAMFDGATWISDFKQREMLPGPAYRKGTANFVIYRYRGSGGAIF